MSAYRNIATLLCVSALIIVAGFFAIERMGSDKAIILIIPLALWVGVFDGVAIALLLMKRSMKKALLAGLGASIAAIVLAWLVVLVAL